MTVQFKHLSKKRPPTKAASVSFSILKASQCHRCHAKLCMLQRFALPSASAYAVIARFRLFYVMNAGSRLGAEQLRSTDRTTGALSRCVVLAAGAGQTNWNRALERGGRQSHVGGPTRLFESYDATLGPPKMPVNKTCGLLPRRSTNGRCLSPSSPPSGNLPATGSGLRLA